MQLKCIYFTQGVRFVGMYVAVQMAAVGNGVIFSKNK